jgi:hypothetical protein
MSGEADAIIRDGHAYLRKFSFARYCDQVLLPGLALGAEEYESGRIETAQQNKVRATIAALAEALVPTSGAPRKNGRRRRLSMLDANVGAHLRQMRQLAGLTGRAGPLDCAVRGLAERTR